MNKGMPNHNTGEVGEAGKAWRVQTAAAAPGLPSGYFEAFFAQHEDALLLLDRSQQTALYNRQFAQWQGWTPGLRVDGALLWSALRQMQTADLAPHASEDGQVFWDTLQQDLDRQHPRRLQGPDGGVVTRQVQRLTLDGHDALFVLRFRGHAPDAGQPPLSCQDAKLLHALLDGVTEQIYFKDSASRFIRISRSLAQRYGLDDPEQAVGKSDANFYAAEHAARTAAEEQQVMRNGEAALDQLHHEVWGDGHESWNLSAKYPLFDDEGEVIGIYGVSRDVTEQKKQEASMWHQAHVDGLTGLPNRRYLLKRLDELRSRRARGEVLLRSCLMMIDLDHFKAVNDRLGHAVGDELLVQVARRLAKAVRETDTVARLGGDEFIVAITDVADRTQVAAIAGKIIDALGAPFSIQDHRIQIAGSAGIALFPEDADDFERLLIRADHAMYGAKRAGGGRFAFFVEDGSQLPETPP